MHVVLLGAPGSGKSTVGRVIAEEHGVPYLSSGDVARRLAEDDPHVRIKLRAGEMAPEAAMCQEMRMALEEADVRCGGWVLDGFPRNMGQLVCLMRWVPYLPTFALLHAAPLTCLERLTARDRSDDGPDAVAARWRAFRADTDPLIQELRSSGALLEQRSEVDPGTVARQLSRMLEDQA